MDADANSNEAYRRFEERLGEIADAQYDHGVWLERIATEVWWVSFAAKTYLALAALAVLIFVIGIFLGAA